MKIKISAATRFELPSGKSEELLWFVEGPQGFGMRVRRSRDGTRVMRQWLINYRQHGRGRRLNIGSADVLTAAQARDKARKLLAKVELGNDPAGDRSERRDKDALNLRSVVADYLNQKTGVKPATMRMARLYLEGPYLKPLHGVAIDRITRKDISSRLLAVSQAKGAPTAIGLRSALSSLFSWAMTMGLVDTNPIVGAFKPPRPASRERVLTDKELAAIWHGVEGDGDYAACIRLLVLTGCRREEIGGMRWSEFAPDMGTWTLPKERAKNGKALTLPVTPLMLEAIGSIARRDGVDHLFNSRGFTRWSSGKQMLDGQLGWQDEKAWVHHDIRRSTATGMANLGIQPHIIEEILNHKSGAKAGVAGIYNRSPYEREVRDAMLRWSEHIRTLPKGGKRKPALSLVQVTCGDDDLGLLPFDRARIEARKVARETGRKVELRDATTDKIISVERHR